MSYATFSAANAFAIELALSSAPSIPFAITEDDGTAVSLSGATLWFMIKGDDNDADADALVTLSTALGSITITDAAGGEGQLDFTAAGLTESAALKARPYPAYFKIKFSTGEIRTFGGQACITPAGITATS